MIIFLFYYFYKLLLKFQSTYKYIILEINDKISFLNIFKIPNCLNIHRIMSINISILQKFYTKLVVKLVNIIIFKSLKFLLVSNFPTNFSILNITFFLMQCFFIF